MKGSQPLEACAACFQWKVSCWTAGKGGRKRTSVKEKGMGKLEESSRSDEENHASGREWLNKFSTMKVGLPKHIKPMAELRCAS